MLSELVNAFECLVVRIYPEFRGPRASAEALDSPGDAPCFEVKGCPVSLVVEGGAADEQDGTDRTVRLLLLEGCANAVLAGVAGQVKRTGVVGNGIPEPGRPRQARWRVPGGAGERWIPWPG